MLLPSVLAAGHQRAHHPYHWGFTITDNYFSETRYLAARCHVALGPSNVT